MKQVHTVKGQDVILRVLPRHLHIADDAWHRFIASDPLSILGLDFETTSAEDVAIDPLNPILTSRLIQFGTETEAWALDPHDKFWRRRIIALLLDPSMRFVSHTPYDSLWVRREFGIDLGDRSIDTKPIADLLYPGRTARKDLKSLSDRFIDDGLTSAQKVLHALFADLYYSQTVRLPKSFVAGESNCRAQGCTKISMIESLCGRCDDHYFDREGDKNVIGWGFTNIPLDDPTFTAYAGLDAIYVRRLLPILGDLVKSKGMAKLSQTEQKVRRYGNGMQYRGHLVDRAWTNTLLIDIEAEYLQSEQNFKDVTHGVNPRSPKAKDWLLDKGMHYVTKTPGGAPKTDKENLPMLVTSNTSNPEVHGALKALLEMSQHKNLLTNLRTIEQKSRHDGTIHPTVKTLQAHTGRMSVTDPAMQTFKKTDPRLRGCFISRPGHSLVGADYDSQEIRIGAALSRDEALLRIVREGLNQHVLTAESLFADWVGKAESPKEYAAAKMLDFAQQYGVGPRKIALQLDISLTEAKKMWNQWRVTYGGLVDWGQYEASKSFVVNPFGRVIPRDAFRPYANSNYLIQSSGRDVLGASLVELADNGWEPHFWLPVHDEMILEVPDDRIEESKSALTKHMTFQFGDIELPAEGELIGKRWGGLKG